MYLCLPMGFASPKLCCESEQGALSTSCARMPLEPDAEIDLEYLLNWLGPTPEEAGQRYELVRQKLLVFFERNGCSPADEWVDKTFDVVARKLAIGETIHTSSPAAYCLGVARLLCKEYWRAPERKHRSLETDDPFKAGDERALFNHELQFACLSQCLNRLPAAEQQIIQSYYDDDWHQQLTNRQALARRLKLTATGLRSRASRIRSQLGLCVKACIARQEK